MKTLLVEDLLLTIGHRFNNPALLEQALTHSSFANETGITENYERLEFLGDAVLELVVSQMLVERYPDWNEGELSRLRASAVNKKTLAAIAQKLGLGDYVRMSFGEYKTGGRQKNTILADVFESVLGAIYLDAGLGAASAFVERYFDVLFAGVDQALLFTDYKTRLQELAQAELQRPPLYRIIDASGPDHAKVFRIEVLIGGQVYGEGTGRSKKQAEQMAAKEACRRLRQDDCKKETTK